MPIAKQGISGIANGTDNEESVNNMHGDEFQPITTGVADAFELLPDTAHSRKPHPSNISRHDPTNHNKEVAYGHTEAIDEASNAARTARTMETGSATSPMKKGIPKSVNVKKNHPFHTKCAERRARMNTGKTGSILSAWADAEPIDGYIYHPDAQWIMHPAYFKEGDFNLCQYADRCKHARNCHETRLRMATLSYIRNESKVTFRDLELIWRLSRSTVQRKVAEVKSKKHTDLHFILNF